MACGCATRMRGVLKLVGYTISEDGSVWTKEGRPAIEDERIEDEHTQVLVESLQAEYFAAKARLFLHQVGDRPID